MHKYTLAHSLTQFMDELTLTHAHYIYIYKHTKCHKSLSIYIYLNCLEECTKNQICLEKHPWCMDASNSAQQFRSEHNASMAPFLRSFYPFLCLLATIHIHVVWGDMKWFSYNFLCLSSTSYADGNFLTSNFLSNNPCCINSTLTHTHIFTQHNCIKFLYKVKILKFVGNWFLTNDK